MYKSCKSFIPEFCATYQVYSNEVHGPNIYARHSFKYKMVDVLYKSLCQAKFCSNTFLSDHINR